MLSEICIQSVKDTLSILPEILTHFPYYLEILSTKLGGVPTYLIHFPETFGYCYIYYIIWSSIILDEMKMNFFLFSFY